MPYPRENFHSLCSFGPGGVQGQEPSGAPAGTCLSPPGSAARLGPVTVGRARAAPGPGKSVSNGGKRCGGVWREGQGVNRPLHGLSGDFLVYSETLGGLGTQREAAAGSRRRRGAGTGGFPSDFTPGEQFEDGPCLFSM